MSDKYKTIKIKKLYNGLAEIRSYQLSEVKKLGQGIRFILNNDERYVPNSMLKAGIRGSTITARFPLPNGAHTYSLIGWKWADLPQSFKGIVSQQLLGI